MKIRKIRLENYRPYRGEATVDLGPSEGEKGFVVFEGVNGAGKSSILNALTWCLYEEEIHLKEEDKALPILNTRILRDLKVNETANVFVEITLEDDDGIEYRFARSMPVRRTMDGRGQPEKSLTEFKLTYREGRDWKFHDSPTFFVQRLMPREIKEYFFFDGEQLNKYFATASGDNIREAVFRISQLQILDETLVHLGAIQADLYKESRDISPQTKALQEKFDALRNGLEGAKKRKDALRDELVAHQAMEQDAEKRLRESNSSVVRELHDQRKRLETLHEKTESEFSRLERERNELLVSMAGRVYAFEVLEKALNLIRHHEGAGEIPSPYRVFFIEKLLATGKCICGTNLSNSPRHAEEVKRFLNRTSTISQLSDKLVTGRAQLHGAIASYSEIDSKMINYAVKLREHEEALTSQSKQMKELSEKIGNSNVEEIARLEDKLIREKSEIQRLQRETGSLEARIEMGSRDIDRTERELQQEIRKQAKHMELSSRLDFCKEAIRVEENIKNDIMDQVRKRIEERTQTQFFELIWKKESYEKVEIDQNYNVKVVQRESGLQALGSLSAGERQVLALSFISALNEVSGYTGPIVIDTPLGRISGEPKSNIAEKLPSYLRGRQVLMFVTDEEYTPKVRQLLKPRVSTEFRIAMVESGGGAAAEVVPYDAK